MIHVLCAAGHTVEFTEKLPPFWKVGDGLIVNDLAQISSGSSMNMLAIGWDAKCIKERIWEHAESEA